MPLFLTALLCSACNVTVSDPKGTAAANASVADSSAKSDAGSEQLAKPQTGYDFVVVPETAGVKRPVNRILQAQVELDRRGFSPGVIDGKDGMNFKSATRGFQQSSGLPVTGELDDTTVKALIGNEAKPDSWLVKIPSDFARGPFFTMPKDMAAKAELPALTYRNLLEKLAERFHTTPETLQALNSPSVKVGAGSVIRVPAVRNQPLATIDGDRRRWAQTLATLAVAKDQPKADQIVVDKSDGLLRAYDGEKRLIAQFPVTTGSQHDPLPLGEWKIRGVSRNPDYHYNPSLFWDAASTDKKAVLKPGPNSPVVVVWIDLSKDHYGIHGTPEPQTIGRTESHGCVRLTNWDAARLAQMVSGSTKVTFQA